jgi:hypothetical protein
MIRVPGLDLRGWRRPHFHVLLVVPAKYFEVGSLFHIDYDE